MDQEEKENLEIQNLKYLNSYYAAEGQRIGNVLKAVGIEKSDLNDTIRENYEILVKCGQMLKLDRINKSYCLLALNDLVKENYVLKAKKNDLSKKIKTLNENLKNLNLFQENLTRDFNQISLKIEDDKVQLNITEDQIQSYKSRYDKYKALIDKYQENLAKVYESIKHENLERDFKEMRELENKVDELAKQLDGYKGLPMNEKLAKLAIQEIKDEIRRIDSEIGVGSID